AGEDVRGGSTHDRVTALHLDLKHSARKADRDLLTTIAPAFFFGDRDRCARARPTGVRDANSTLPNDEIDLALALDGREFDVGSTREARMGRDTRADDVDDGARDGARRDCVRVTRIAES